MGREDTLLAACAASRPVDYASAKQRPPHQHGLKQQPRQVIAPAKDVTVEGDVFQCMFDIGGEHTYRVKGQHDSREPAAAWQQQARRTEQLAHPGEDHYRVRPRHPAGHDGNKALGGVQMKKTGNQVHRDQ